MVFYVNERPGRWPSNSKKKSDTTTLTSQSPPIKHHNEMLTGRGKAPGTG